MNTSALPGEGKTTISVGLAQNLGSMGKKVLLIEGDMRRRVLDNYTESTEKNVKGIFSAIQSDQNPLDLVSFDSLMGIDVLMAGASGLNPADVIGSEKFAEMMHELRQVYDHIVVDSPPVLIVPDARIMARYADFIVLAIRWDQTTRPQVKAALNQMDSVNYPVDGVVLNQVDPQGLRRYGYGNEYGASYQYGSGYYSN